MNTYMRIQIKLMIWIYITNWKINTEMGKKTKLKDVKTGKIIIVDEDTCYTTTYAEMVKSGIFGRKDQYKYFYEHPDEIENQKLFSELEEEFKDDNT